MKPHFILIFTLSSLILHAESLPELITRYQADEAALQRKYTITESAEYYERFLQLYTSWQEELNKVAFEQLSPGEKVDYLLFKNHLDKEAYFLRIRQKDFEEVAYVADFATPLYTFIRQRRRGADVDATTLSRTFDEMLKATRLAKDKLGKATPFSSWQKADKAGDVVKSLRDNLKEAYTF